MIITFPLAYLFAPHILVPYLTSPFSFFTPRKMHPGHHHINRLLSRIRQNGLKNQMLLHFAHYDQWERENLRGVHWKSSGIQLWVRVA